jgi:hypothetical protein
MRSENRKLEAHQISRPCVQGACLTPFSTSGVRAIFFCIQKLITEARMQEIDEYYSVRNDGERQPLLTAMTPEEKTWDEANRFQRWAIKARQKITAQNPNARFVTPEPEWTGFFHFTEFFLPVYIRARTVLKRPIRTPHIKCQLNPALSAAWM